ncbi:unnamed protein product [Camellia sinensis]
MPIRLAKTLDLTAMLSRVLGLLEFSKTNGLHIFVDKGAEKIENPKNGNVFKVTGQRLKPVLENFPPEEERNPVVAEATLDFRNLNKRKLLTNFPTFLPQLFPSLVDLPSKFVFQAWLLILYTGLALRENILRVNGSDIRPCVDKTSLLRYGHGTYQSHLGDPEAEGCNCSFNGLSCKELQCFYKIDINGKGFVHILHSASLLCVCVCTWLGALCETLSSCMARRMDVVWGETAGVDGQLWLLAPILFILQGFEAYVEILLLKAALAGVVFEWQVVTCGVLLIVMAVGNFVNTVQTLVAKSRFKAKMKKTKSKLELNLGSHPIPYNL